MKAFLNGSLIEEKEIRIDPNDLIVQRGYGIFDFFKVLQGKPLFVENHLERLVKSAAIARLPLKWSRQELLDMILTLIQENGEPEGGIKILLTGGVSPMGFEIGKPNLILLQNLAKSPPDERYRIGSNLITHEYLRDVPQVKTTNYFTGVWLHNEMRKHNAVDVVYHYEGNLLELSRSNIFLVMDTNLITPNDQILEGITRGKVLGLAHGILPIIIRQVKFKELKQAKEIFITSTLKKVMPIVEVDGQKVGDGKPGEITAQLMESFDNHVKIYLNQ